MGNIVLKIENVDDEDLVKYQEIFAVLAVSGTLKLRGVGIVIHLDKDNTFQGIEVQNYWPWRRKTGEQPLTFKK